jgi:hypothetical protein
VDAYRESSVRDTDDCFRIARHPGAGEPNLGGHILVVFIELAAPIKTALIVRSN